MYIEAMEKKDLASHRRENFSKVLFGLPKPGSWPYLSNNAE
jgi:hypothetical protein